MYPRAPSFQSSPFPPWQPVISLSRFVLTIASRPLFPSYTLSFLQFPDLRFADTLLQFSYGFVLSRSPE